MRVVSKPLYQARRLALCRLAALRTGASTRQNCAVASTHFMVPSKGRFAAMPPRWYSKKYIEYNHTAQVAASTSGDSVDIEKLAELAQLRLTDEEKEEIGPQISGIIEWMGQLNNVDVDGVRPSMRGGDVDTGRNLDVGWLRKDAEADDPEDVEGRAGVLQRTNDEGFVPVKKDVFR